MILSANADSFGHPEQFTSREFRHILDLVDGYVQFEEFYPRDKEKNNGNKSTDK